MKVQATHLRLRLKLMAMAKADQAMRINAIESGAEWDDSMDQRHTFQLKRIIARYGWPTIPMVGKEASYGAWLIAQHADRDLQFQKECLALLKALPATEISPQNIAYLEDRILVAEHQPQLYGTQFQGSGDNLEPQPIQDPTHVDERRRLMNLGTLEEYRRTMHEMYDKN